MNLSLSIGFLMLAMKMTAYFLTGSAAILSDAAESVVHVAAVGFASYSLRLTYQPADATHPYGHAKISFFSAGFEGALIAMAALYIIYESIHKWIDGLAPQNLGLGTILTAVAALINGGLGAYLVWLGRRNHSIIIEANGKHVLTDCWTSLGVIIGLCLAMFTGWMPWDPLCAILVASNILISAFGLMRRSVGGLMDEADPVVQKQLQAILDRETSKRGITYHSLRHRDLGVSHWVEVHLLFPSSTTICDAHQRATEIEEVIENSLQPSAQVITHLEAAECHDKVHKRPEA